jgi:hypothetical protein
MLILEGPPILRTDDIPRLERRSDENDSTFWNGSWSVFKNE